MSKESYVRGFCKAAEAAGVDPQALAKFAAETKSEPQYKTDGYVPTLDDKSEPYIGKQDLDLRDPKNWIDIPYLYSDSIGRKTPNSREYLRWGGLYRPEYREVHRLRSELDPRFANWISAHTNASAKARSPLVRAGYPYEKAIPKDLGEMIAKIYNDEMKRTTSAPPAQASAPAAKK